jgi:hypothetical protein
VVPLPEIATMREGTSSPIESVNACSTEIENRPGRSASSANRPFASVCVVWKTESSAASTGVATTVASRRGMRCTLSVTVPTSRCD